MDAIETRYLGATDYRPGRIHAVTLGNFKAQLTLSYDHSLSAFENHRVATRELLEQIGWTGVSFVPGSTKTGYVWAALVADDDHVRAWKPLAGSAADKRANAALADVDLSIPERES